jgi:hypothetical protein
MSMKWTKLGKIFNPADHNLIYNGVGFAQSPQPVVFDNHVRFYFSTREKDESGKFLSHPSYVDFDLSFKQILKVADHEIIPLGKLGCFDEHGIFPFHVVKDGNRLLAYTTGWNRKISVSADASVGLAISENGGESFTKIGDGPVLTASLDEPFLVGDSFVKKFDSLFHMWYIFGVRWAESIGEKEPQRVYKIAHATSEDGINWIRDGKTIISDVLNQNECQALPTVIEIDSKYHMFFCFREAFGFRTDANKGYRIGYAYSSDLTSWTRDDKALNLSVSETGWDSEMMCYPNVFECDGIVYLAYNGNQFGREGFGLARLEHL